MTSSPHPRIYVTERVQDLLDEMNKYRYRKKSTNNSILDDYEYDMLELHRSIVEEQKKIFLWKIFPLSRVNS